MKRRVKYYHGVLTILATFLDLSSPEWLATVSGIPPYSHKEPDNLTVNITWQVDELSQPINKVLSLKKTQAVETEIPVYKNDENGKPYLAAMSDLTGTLFYHDIDMLASISLTSVNSRYQLKGSFMLDNVKHEIDPYHHLKHKRSLYVTDDHYIIRRSQVPEHDLLTDYSIPDGNRYGAEYEGVEYLMDDEVPVDTAHGRSKRQALPDTTYIIQLYIVVDFYLYQDLTDSASAIGWQGNTTDYIAFVMGHTANEIDVRFRNINASSVNSSFTWTIGTKLSYLHIAETGAQSPWTYPSTSGKLDALAGLDNFTSWYQNNAASLPSDADHLLLLTGLDLTLNSHSGTVGYASLSGLCDDRRVSINEPYSSTVLAHEIGHNLGAQHDGVGNQCNGSYNYVMAPSSGITANATRGNPWIFSSCSIEYFDSYIGSLNSAGKNCLENNGSYIPSWAGNYDEYFGQTISLDEQCRLTHGEGYYYSYQPDNFLKICQQLVCTQDGAWSVWRRAAYQYTSCGNKKWCVEEQCVEHPQAPPLDEQCPVGDRRGQLYTNSNETCADMTAVECSYSNDVELKCCFTCAKLAKLWLGPNCSYGDKHVDCPTYAQFACDSLKDTCCESCCNVTGPEPGYSCEPPLITMTTYSANNNTQDTTEIGNFSTTGIYTTTGDLLSTKFNESSANTTTNIMTVTSTGILSTDVSTTTEDSLQHATSGTIIAGKTLITGINSTPKSTTGLTTPLTTKITTSFTTATTTPYSATATLTTATPATMPTTTTTTKTTTTTPTTMPTATTTTKTTTTTTTTSTTPYPTTTPITSPHTAMTPATTITTTTSPYPTITSTPTTASTTPLTTVAMPATTPTTTSTIQPSSTKMSTTLQIMTATPITTTTVPHTSTASTPATTTTLPSTTTTLASTATTLPSTTTKLPSTTTTLPSTTIPTATTPATATTLQSTIDTTPRITTIIAFPSTTTTTPHTTNTTNTVSATTNAMPHASTTIAMPVSTTTIPHLTTTTTIPATTSTTSHITATTITPVTATTQYLTNTTTKPSTMSSVTFTSEVASSTLHAMSNMSFSTIVHSSTANQTSAAPSTPIAPSLPSTLPATATPVQVPTSIANATNGSTAFTIKPTMATASLAKFVTTNSVTGTAMQSSTAAITLSNKAGSTPVAALTTTPTLTSTASKMNQSTGAITNTPNTHSTLISATTLAAATNISHKGSTSTSSTDGTQMTTANTTAKLTSSLSTYVPSVSMVTNTLPNTSVGSNVTETTGITSTTVDNTKNTTAKLVSKMTTWSAFSSNFTSTKSSSFDTTASSKITPSIFTTPKKSKPTSKMFSTDATTKPVIRKTSITATRKEPLNGTISTAAKVSKVTMGFKTTASNTTAYPTVVESASIHRTASSHPSSFNVTSTAADISQTTGYSSTGNTKAVYNTSTLSTTQLSHWVTTTNDLAYIATTSNSLTITKILLNETVTTTATLSTTTASNSDTPTSSPSHQPTTIPVFTETTMTLNYTTETDESPILISSPTPVSLSPAPPISTPVSTSLQTVPPSSPKVVPSVITEATKIIVTSQPSVTKIISKVQRKFLNNKNTDLSAKRLETNPGVQMRMFAIEIRITVIRSGSFVCDDPDLQDSETRTYRKFHNIVCVSISSAVNQVTRCGIFTVSCGSFVVSGLVEVAEDDSGDPANAAPTNTEEFIRQAARLLNSSVLELATAPTAEDVNECSYSDLNGCSSNSKCSNTDGYYSCNCIEEYSKDLSEYEKLPGRVCAIPCTGSTCSANEEQCIELPESAPRCEALQDETVTTSEALKWLRKFEPLLIVVALAAVCMSATLILAGVAYYKRPTRRIHSYPSTADISLSLSNA